MRTTLLVFAVLLLAPAAMAQIQVSPGQTLTAAWDPFDCSHICDQPAGTAGVRIRIDGAIVEDLGIPTLPLTFDVTSPGRGVHTVALEVYNCRGGCSGTIPPPPVRPAAPVLTVSTGERSEVGPSATFDDRR